MCRNVIVSRVGSICIVLVLGWLVVACDGGSDVAQLFVCDTQRQDVELQSLCFKTPTDQDKIEDKDKVDPTVRVVAGRENPVWGDSVTYAITHAENLQGEVRWSIERGTAFPQGTANTVGPSGVIDAQRQFVVVYNAYEDIVSMYAGQDINYTILAVSDVGSHTFTASLKALGIQVMITEVDRVGKKVKFATKILNRQVLVDITEPTAHQTIGIWETRNLLYGWRGAGIVKHPQFTGFFSENTINTEKVNLGMELTSIDGYDMHFVLSTENNELPEKIYIEFRVHLDGSLAFYSKFDLYVNGLRTVIAGQEAILGKEQNVASKIVYVFDASVPQGDMLSTYYNICDTDRAAVAGCTVL